LPVFSLPAISATLSGTLAPTVVPLANGGQANIAVSNTDPNLFTVSGDRITAINSLDGGLTNQEQTDSGGAILATVSKKPFTFIVETERGLNFSIRAVPRAGVGRTIQLVSELVGTPGPAKSWEESGPYEVFWFLLTVLFARVRSLMNTRLFLSHRNHCRCPLVCVRQRKKSGPGIT
jgi:conjugal transfer pilus assembly protein TraK